MKKFYKKYKRKKQNQNKLELKWKKMMEITVKISKTQEVNHKKMMMKIALKLEKFKEKLLDQKTL